MSTPPPPFTPIDWQYRLGSVYFNTAGEPDDLGCTWTMPTPDGWESPQHRGGSTQDIPFDDGQDVPDSYYGARVIRCSGLLQAPSAEVLERAKSRLLRETRLMHADGQFVARYLTGPDRYCTVRKGGQTLFPNRHDPLTTDFDFQLIAGDPYKYGVVPDVKVVTSLTPVGGLTFPLTFPLTFTTDIDLSGEAPASLNIGDMPAPMLLAFTGPLNPPTLVDRLTSRRLALRDAIQPGRTVYVDTRAQTILLDGDSVWTSLDTVTSTDFEDFTVPPADDFGVPGRCEWQLFGAGSGQCVITTPPTWE